MPPPLTAEGRSRLSSLLDRGDLSEPVRAQIQAQLAESPPPPTAADPQPASTTPGPHVTEMPTQHIEGNVPEPSAWDGFKDTMRDGVNAYSQAGMLGHADEAFGKYAESQLGGGEPTKLRNRELYRDMLAQGKKRSPTATTIGSLAGSIGPALVMSPLGAVAGSGVGAAIQAHGDSDEADAGETATNMLVGGAAGVSMGELGQGIPGVARYLGTKLGGAAKRMGSLADDYLMRAGGATADEVGALGSRIGDYAKKARELMFDKDMPSARDIGDRATKSADLYRGKAEAIGDSLGADAVVPASDVATPIRKLKGPYPRGGSASQPVRNKLDEVANSWAYDMTKKPMSIPPSPMRDVGANASDASALASTRARRGPPPLPQKQTLRLDPEDIKYTDPKPKPEVPDWYEAEVTHPDDAVNETPDVANGSSRVPDDDPIAALADDAPEPMTLEQQPYEYEAPAPTPWADPERQLQAELEQSRMAEATANKSREEARGLAYGANDNGGTGLARRDAMSTRNPDVHADVVGDGPMSEWDGYSQPPESTNEGAGIADVWGFDEGRPTVQGKASVSGTDIARRGPDAAGADLATGAAEDTARVRYGIPFREANAERMQYGRRAFEGGSTDKHVQRDVYGAINTGIRRAADRIVPGSGAALRDANWNEHVSITFRDWARDKALRQTNNMRLPFAAGSGGAVGGAVGALTGGVGGAMKGASVGAALGGGLSSAVKGREHVIMSKAAGAAQSGAEWASGKANQAASGLDKAITPGAIYASTGGGSSLGMATASAIRGDQEATAHKQAGDEGRGQLMGAALERMLKTEPEKLGVFQRRIAETAQKQDPVAWSALLSDLDRNPEFKRTVRKRALELTKSMP